MDFFKQLCLIVFYICNVIVTKSNYKYNDSINTLPNFRKMVEEVDDETTMETSSAGDSRNNLVQLLVNNVKEIFEVPDDFTENIQNDNDTDEDSETVLITRPIIETTFMPETSFSATRTTDPTDTTIYENITLTSFFYSKTTREIISTEGNLKKILKNPKEALIKSLENENTTEIDFLEEYHNNTLTALTTEVVISELRDKMINCVHSLTNAVVISSQNEPENSKRSCIVCNNVAEKDCYDPKNKLITSVICEEEEDLCFSMHTPFGIVDRGCFNANNNLTTYVCSCNLCNYIPLVNLPYMFKTKQEWIDNVIEMTRTKYFKKSIFKEMNCIRCEVNTTLNKGKGQDDMNCLHGNIALLPTQECEEDEICGIKSVKSKGYIWRGCLKYPLFNYWWSLCDTDLCNYETLVSIYGEL